MRDHIVQSLVAVAAALAFLLLASGGWVDAAAAPPVDNSIYAELLTKYVANGYVNYAGFKRDETRLDQYLEVLEQADPERLPREEQFAFYICAPKSCPPLISEPYLGASLDAQLNRSTRDFLNTPANYRLDRNTFWFSSIFKWFAEDFNKDVVGFYAKHAEADLKKSLETNRGRIEVKYLDYDWSLNGK